MKITKRQLRRVIAEELDIMGEVAPLARVAAATIADKAASEIMAQAAASAPEEEDPFEDEPEESEAELEAKPDEDIEEPEREAIVMRISDAMDNAGITGQGGLLEQVDDVDEFEDLLRLVLDEVGLESKSMASVALDVARDFLEMPTTAGQMSTYDL
jgi:hypothetical protein